MNSYLMTRALLASLANTTKSCPFPTARGPSPTLSPFSSPLTSLLSSKTEMSQPSASTHVLVDEMNHLSLLLYHEPEVQPLRHPG